jgi:hypothetical protein
MIKYALYSDVPNMYIRMLEADSLVTRTSTAEIHAWLDEREPQTLKACPNHLDTPRLTNHGNTVDARLKVADMELQTPGDTAEFTISTSTDNEVWGSEVTLTTHERIVKKTEVNSHKEWALEFNVEPSLDHKSNWPRHQGPRAIIHWEKCGCYRCIPIKTPFKIPAQYEPISGLSFVVPLDEVWCKLGG